MRARGDRQPKSRKAIVLLPVSFFWRRISCVLRLRRAMKQLRDCENGITRIWHQEGLQRAARRVQRPVGVLGSRSNIR